MVSSASEETDLDELIKYLLEDSKRLARIERQRNPGLTVPLAKACAILAGISRPIFRQYSTPHEVSRVG